MKIIPCSPAGNDITPMREQISEWRLARVYRLASYRLGLYETTYDHNYWIGSSRDGRVWALSVEDETDKVGTPNRSYAQTPGKIVAFLVDPPKRSEDTISDILLSVYFASSDGPPNSALIGQIIHACPFPEYRMVSSYLPEAPTDWLDLPAELEVGIELSEEGCIGEDTFKRYERDSFEDAVHVVCGPGEDLILIGYSLMVRGVFPLLGWKVNGPFDGECGKASSERRKVQGDAPWERIPDQTLLCIYQYLPRQGKWGAPHPYHNSVPRLEVAGRTAKEAAANWDKCAKALRLLKPPAPRTWEFPSSRDPKKIYSVAIGRSGFLQCTCPGFEYRGECTHVRNVQKTTSTELGL